jgi:hypothetical protein
MKTSTQDTLTYRVWYYQGLQPHVPEPIVAVGILNQGDGMRNTLLGKASPMVFHALRHKTRKQAHGLPNTVAVAVTDRNVHLFSYSGRRDGMDVGQEVARWDRAGLSVSLRPTSLATQVDVDLADGTRYRLESTKGSDFNDELLDHLCTPPVA